MPEVKGIDNPSLNHPLIAIVGPTGVGKSHLAIYLAQKFDGEIVNADSRQVYRFMDIGTAKPSSHEMTLVPHHLFDIINPDEDFSLAQYQEKAKSIIHEIQSKRKIPLLVGGSGQYVWGLLEGWEVPRIPPDLKLRSELEKQAIDLGIDYLYTKLQELDPDAAQKIDKRNVRRVIRALEVTMQSGTPFSKLQIKKSPDYQTLMIGLTAERTELYLRTDSRVDKMMKQGLVSETEKLTQMGYGYNIPSMSSIGYQQIGDMLRGEISLDEAIEQIKTSTHRFVRHQYAWFRLKDKRINWFDVQNSIELEISELTANFLDNKIL